MGYSAWGRKELEMTDNTQHTTHNTHAHQHSAHNSTHHHHLGGKRASLTAHLVKNLPATQETPVRFLGPEDPLEKV